MIGTLVPAGRRERGRTLHGMRVHGGETAGRDTLGPWFRRCPRVAIVTALALFAGTFALEATALGPDRTLTVVYALPISLLAMGFGVGAGIAAGTGAIGLLALGAVQGGDRLSSIEWVAQSITLVLLGGLIGTASDRLREAERIRRHATAVALLQRDAAEINDELVQGLAATKWLLETGDTERSLVMLEENLVAAQQLASRSARRARMRV
jgi:hypothetical protein